MKIIIHGGMLEYDDQERIKKMNESLRDIVKDAYQYMETHTALETVIHAVTMLEDNPLFNAGTGSELQDDGKIRMSAAISDGAKLLNSGVVNIMDVQNPIRVAELLLERDDKALSGAEAVSFARKQGFPSYFPETPERRKEFEDNKESTGRGTVGCVALDAKGNIAAATSTGGNGMELPGRVSDSSSVAGNYANKFCGISCTGTGEDIVNNALAAKIVVRVTDGTPIGDALEKSLGEVETVDGDAGVIGIDSNGTICQKSTKADVCFAAFDGEMLQSFLDNNNLYPLN